jgi:hypothetical protein
MKLLRLMRMPKTQTENSGGNLLWKTSAENFCVSQNLGGLENCCGKLLRHTKSMRLIICDRTKADVETSASGKIAASAELTCL